MKNTRKVQVGQDKILGIHHSKNTLREQLGEKSQPGKRSFYFQDGFASDVMRDAAQHR